MHGAMMNNKDIYIYEFAEELLQLLANICSNINLKFNQDSASVNHYFDIVWYLKE
jgi:hypothetical protein